MNSGRSRKTSDAFCCFVYFGCFFLKMLELWGDMSCADRHLYTVIYISILRRGSFILVQFFIAEPTPLANCLFLIVECVPYQKLNHFKLTLVWLKWKISAGKMGLSVAHLWIGCVCTHFNLKYVQRFYFPKSTHDICTCRITLLKFLLFLLRSIVHRPTISSKILRKGSSPVFATQGDKCHCRGKSGRESPFLDNR